MADQKALKKRLKKLMILPENQICSDCPEKKPTWASLIVPPPGSPPGVGKIGAFMCLECSGSHRRLGVHISFVRSVNLDSWKEDEVRAMENGGNAKVNSIFEARLAQSGRPKPTNLADGPTRERFIRDKYERRKFYDPAGYANPGNAGASTVGGTASAPSSNGSRGTPSDVAHQRVANRQAKMRPSASMGVSAAPASAPPPVPAAAPVSAPVVMDLLDFGAAPAPAATASTPAHDPFAAPPVASAPTPVPAPAPVAADPFAAAATPTLAPPPVAAATPTPAPAPTPSTATPAKSSNDSILALFNTPPQPTSFAHMQQQQQTPQQQGGSAGMMMGMMNTNGNNNNTNMLMMNGGGQMNAQQQQQMMMMRMQQQKQQQMMMMNQNNSNNMQGMNPNMGMGMMSPQQGMNMGMNMMNGSPGMNMGGMNMGMNMNMMNGGNMQQQPNQMNAMMQGMQNMSMQQQQPQQNNGGGFGAPMGGSGKQDPFSSLGGMNAFR